MATPQLATPSDLDADASAKIAAALNPLIADAFALYLKTKNFHWHMSGSHYREYHLLLDDQGDQIFAMTDVLAERVRKTGGTTLRSIGDVSRQQKVADNDEAFVSPSNMLRDLMLDNKAYAARQRAAHAIVVEVNDVASASLLEIFIDETERRTWFLYESFVGGEHTA